MTLALNLPDGTEVRLRPFEHREGDLDLLARIGSDPFMLAVAMPELPIPVTREVFRQRLAAGSLAPLSGNDMDLEFAVVIGGDHDHPIGVGGLYGLGYPQPTVEAGVILCADDIRGKGYGADVAALLTRFAIRGHRRSKVSFQVKSNNKPALAALNRLGVKRHAILPKHRWCDGELVDLHVFGVMAEEWTDKALRWREGPVRP